MAYDFFLSTLVLLLCRGLKNYSMNTITKKLKQIRLSFDSS